MKTIAEICMKIWLCFIVVYPFFYAIAYKVRMSNLIGKISTFYISFSQYTIGLFGILVLMMWWGTHLRGSIVDVFTFFGFFVLAIVILLVTVFFVAPFSP